MESSASLIDAGLTITLIGMSVVFVLLTLLVGVIQIMSVLCRRFAPMPVPAKAPSTDDSELVSVIAAAVAMHRRRGQ
jgi:sodium pump decarboxylase gamma subunit